MRARDLFGVAVRVIGFWFLTQSAYWLSWAVAKGHDATLGNPGITVREDGAYATIYLLLGVVVTLAADPIVWLYYGLPPKPAPDEGAAERAE